MSSALLVIDMQSGFVHPKGSLPSLGMGMPNIDSVIAENAAVIKAARAAGLPVIYTRSVFRPGMVDLPMRMEGFLPPNFELLERGSWDADIHSDLTRDFDMLVGSDRVAGAPGQHEASLNIMSAAFATVLPWREALSRLTDTPVSAWPAPVAA